MFLTAFAVSSQVLGVEPEPSIPDELEPWIPWVLGEDDQRACPLVGALIGIGGERSCAWPGRLALELDRTGGRFTQRWHLYARSWVPLPGAPVRPRRVEVIADGWRVEGIDDKGRAGPQIRLVRLPRGDQETVL